MKQLLVRKPAYRLGQGAGGTADIKRHPWFNGFDWEAFMAKKLKPPYLPVVSAPHAMLHKCCMPSHTAASSGAIWQQLYQGINGAVK